MPEEASFLFFSLKSPLKMQDNALREIFSKQFLHALFQPYGRLQRRPFAYCLLLYIIISIGLSWAGLLLMPLMPAMVMLINVLLSVVIAAVMLCLTMRRYHDFGCTGWVPGGSLLLAFFFGIMQSWPGSPLTMKENVGWVAVANVVLSALGLITMVIIPLFIPTTSKKTRYDRR